MFFIYPALIVAVALLAAIGVYVRAFRVSSLRMTVVLLALLFILVSLLLYYFLGAAPMLISQYQTKQQIEQKGSQQVMQEAIATLENKVGDNPQQKILLAQVYEMSGKLEQARALYLEVGTQTNDLNALSKYLQLEYATTGTLSKQAAQLVAQLLAANSNNPLLMSLQADYLQQQKNYLQAAKLWSQLLTLAQSEEEYQYVKNALEDVMMLFNEEDVQGFAKWQATQVHILVNIALSSAAQALVRTSDTLFVSIKKPNQAQPLAARRIKAPTFPLQLMISNKDLLPPATGFSDTLLVKASISANGRPLSAADVVAQKTLNISNNQPTITLTLDAQP